MRKSLTKTMRVCAVTHLQQLIRKSLRRRGTPTASSLGCIIQVASVKNWKLQKEYDVEFPPTGQRKLRFIERHPLFLIQGEKPKKSPKRLIDMRGPEPVHNFLMHKQYGIKALGAGQMRWGHFDGIRNYINRNIDEKRMFAIWRTDPPWKPVTKKGLGQRMGGGKGSIDHYVTPLRKDRIIIELGGHCDFEEVEPLLRRVAQKLPFKAKAVSHKMLEEERILEEEHERQNMNPFNFEKCLQKNFLGSQKWASPYDYIWHNKYH